MELGEFADKVEEIEKEDEDLKKITKTAHLLNSSQDQVEKSARFIQGRVFPAWDQRKLDIGPSLLYKSLSLSSGISEKEIEELVKEKGGVGEAAESLETRQQTLVQKTLTLESLQKGLEKISRVEGEGSEKKKVRILADFFSGCDKLAKKYLARLVLGKMRVGVGEGTVRDGIVEAFEVSKNSVERALMVTNDSGRVARVAKDKGENGLKDLKIKIGRPVKPMLAQEGDIDSIIEDIGSKDGKVAVEWKIDGARLQIHKKGNNVMLYSRKLEEVTEALPDIVKFVNNKIEDEEVIIDSEVVAINKENNEPLPFKEVMKRFRREYNIEEMSEEINLNLYSFDILYKNSKELIDLPLKERYKELDSTISKTPNRAITENIEEIKRIEKEALESGHEGVLVKNLNSKYTPGRRGKDWLKFKPEPENLDLVVTGGEWGEGRRSGVVGSFLLSAQTEGELKTVGKVATGFTDKELEEMTEKFKSLIEKEEGKEISFSPKIVFQVGFEEIQESSKYSSGYTIRFPRFLDIREDLGVEDADTVQRIERLYQKY